MKQLIRISNFLAAAKKTEFTTATPAQLINEGGLR